MADFPVITSVTAVQTDQFLTQSGTTVTATTNVGTVLSVYVNGIAQRKTTDWSIAGQVVTFVSTLVSDDVILVYTTSQATLNGNISVIHQEFASASGTTVTLNQTAIGGVVMVARNGVVQRETTDYTINYTTGVITFTTTLASEQVTVAYISGGGGVGNATTLNGFTQSSSASPNSLAQLDSGGLISKAQLLTHAPVIQAFGRFTAQTAAKAAVATYTPAADGSFKVSANVRVTTSTSHSFTVTCAYTDEANVAQTATLQFQIPGGSITGAVISANGALPYMGLSINIRAKAGTSVTIATTGTFTTVTYNVEGLIEQVA